MTPHCAQRLAHLNNQLAEILMTAAILVEEVRTVVNAELDGSGTILRGHPGAVSLPVRSSNDYRPILDQSTLCVAWKGKSLHLGHTRAFAFLERISRRPNQYVTHLDLLREVWDDEELAVATIRSVVRHLRRRLREGGMGELAAAIHGHNGRYILEL